jgi:hypothetical protein
MHTTNSEQQTTNNATDRVCRHLFTLGRRCGSPCLRGEPFCYYHRASRPKPKATGTDAFFAGPDAFEIPSLEDRPAIQLAITDLARRIAGKAIDLKYARALTAVFHIASINLTHQERTGTGCPIHGVLQVSNPRPGNSTSASSRSTSKSNASNPQPTNNQPPVVSEVTFSPTLGPLAPDLEYGLPEPEEEQEPSLASRIYSWLDAPPPPEPVPLERRPYDFDTLQLLRRTLATTTNPETATRIRKALEEEALLPGHNLHIQACIDTGCRPEPAEGSGSPDVGVLPPPSPKPERPIPRTPCLIPERQKALARLPRVTKAHSSEPQHLRPPFTAPP